MKKVTGIGGIFFKAKDPKALSAWYEKHLGISFDDYNSSTFNWSSDSSGVTAFCFFKHDTDYFQPGEKPFMINFRVENLVLLLEELKKEGVETAGEMQDYDYGKFGWIIDPEGNKVELWEPVDEKK